MQLNSKQVEAINHINGPLLILAGAGSGKTRVIVNRIANLITNHNIYPTNILAVTFTNKAAGEMRSRLETEFRINTKGLWISTFHSTCLRILRRHADKIGYNKNFQIFDDGSQLSLIKECIKELDINDKLITPGSALNYISRAKDKCMSPEDHLASADNFYIKKISEIYSLYEQKKYKIQAMDFGDLIKNTVVLFETHSDIKNGYENLFKYILVDEYQDTNHAQYRFIKALAQKHQNICVVGDEDQSIYKWRGADISNILRFEKDFQDTTTIRLEQNYRSTKTIINAAHSVIVNNSERKDKKLWTENSDGEAIRILSSPTEKEEAEKTVKEIKKLSEKNVSLNNIAIFYRTNAQSRTFEETFLKHRISHKIFGSMRFYERKEIKDIIAYLRLLSQPKDDISFLRIINVPARGIGKETINRLKAFSNKNNSTLFDSIKDFLMNNTIRPNISSKLLGFSKLIEELRSDISDKTITEVINNIIEKTGYIDNLNSKNSYEAEDRTANINELVKATGEFVPEESETSNITQFLDQISLVSQIDDLKYEDGTVTLMTVHLAKGLEFDYVFMAGMEEGLFPHARSLDDPSQLEEERRLCYVGMTRARQGLFMTYAFRRQIFGNSNYSIVSRFIDEMPDEYKIKPAPKVFDSSQTYPTQTAMTDDFDFDQRPAEEIFGQGTRVMHPVFGHGSVMQCEATTGGHKVVVKFNTGAVKKLIAEKAGLICV